MPGLVAQYPVAPFTTPVNGDDLDAALVVSHDSSIASAHTAHDADPSIHFQSSTLAARPGAGIVGRKWITSDGLRVYYDTGAVWSEIDYLCKTAGGVVGGATTFNAGIVSTTGTFSGAVTTGGLTVSGPLLNTGAQMGRFEGNGGGAGGTGPGIEIYKGGIQSFNRTTVALGPIQFDASAFTFNGGATFNNGIVVTGGITGTLQTAAQPNVTSLGVQASDFLFVDGTFDIGKSGATRPRDGFFSRNFNVGNGLNVSGSIVVGGFVLGAANKGVLIGNSFFGQQGSGYGEVGYNNNDGAGALNYSVADFASRLRFNSGGLSFQTAPSGLVGAAITFTERVLITQSGAVLVGATTAASVTAGEISLANNKGYRSANAANSGTFNLIALDATDKVSIDGNARGSVFGAGAVFAGALSGITTLNASGALTSVGLVVTGGAGTAVITGDIKVQGALSGFVIGRRDTNAATFTWYSAAGNLQLFDVGAGADAITVTTTTSLVTLRAGLTVAGAVAGVTTLAMSAGLSGVTTIAMNGALSGATTIAASSSVDVGVAHVKAGATTAVGVGSATTIYTAVNSGGYAVVFGSSAGRVFCDTITWDTGTSQIFAISSTVIAGVPSGRTYSLSGSNIQLTMAAAATSVKLLPIEFN